MDTAAAARNLLGHLASKLQCRTLECLTGLDAGRRFPVADGATVIGRGQGAGIRIRDRHVSRHHAQLVARGGQLQVEALSSTNGVRVNGQRLRGPAALADGDRIRLGATVLVFKDPSAPQSAVDGPKALDVHEAPSTEPSPGSTAVAALGVAMALAGVLVAWTFSREAEPVPRDPPTAPSAAGAEQRSW